MDQSPRFQFVSVLARFLLPNVFLSDVGQVSLNPTNYTVDWTNI